MFLPIEDNVVLQNVTDDGQTAGGVIIPDTTQEGTLQGEVIAVGPGRHFENGERSNMQCNSGDIVVYPKYGAKELEVDGDLKVEVSFPSKIEEGTKGSISFLANDKYEKYLYATKSTIVLVNKNFVRQLGIFFQLIY